VHSLDARIQKCELTSGNGRSRVIWLGDLNYRIALSYSEAKKLVEANDWGTLLEKDQVSYQIHGSVLHSAYTLSASVHWVF
jgi:hypothetical protein